MRDAALRLGWKLIDESSSDKAKKSCNVLWVDTSNVQNYLNSILPWQRINHFPGMVNIARKTRLAENLEMMKKEFEEEYDFFPTTFVVPRDLASLKDFFGVSGRSKHTFIVKPDGGCQGKGIFLTKSLEAIEEMKTTHVAQRYIPNPLLIDGKKFDLRVYVLVTSCDPLRIYLFRDGLVRLCTEDFIKPNSSNMDDMTMHLTNYSINKKSDRFEGSDGDDSGSKRSIKWFLSWLSGLKDKQTADGLWVSIGEICTKTMLSIAPTLLREYRTTFGIGSLSFVEDEPSNCNNPIEIQTEKEMSIKELVTGSRCFAVLGFDIMVDSDIKAHLIEVNHLPSFATGSPLDKDIKSKVCFQALSALKCESSDQQNHELTERKKRMNRLRGFRSNSIYARRHSDHRDGEEKGLSVVASKDLGDIEELVKEIYAKYAPEKINKVDTLLKKYRGYEDWLIKQLQEKYVDGSEEGDICDEESISSSDSLDPIPLNELEDTELLAEHKVLVEEGEYDRIYPPGTESKLGVFDKMLNHARDHDDKEQKRLTCPLWLQRRHGRDDDDAAGVESFRSEKEYMAPNRGDWMFRGNVHIQKADIPTKIIQAPSQKQIEAAERLTKGYSVEDRIRVGSNIEEGHTTFLNRLGKAEEVGRQWRKRNESKYRSKARLQMTPINLELNSNDTMNAFDYDRGERYYVDFAGRKIG